MVISLTLIANACSLREEAKAGGDIQNKHFCTYTICSAYNLSIFRGQPYQTQEKIPVSEFAESNLLEDAIGHVIASIWENFHPNKSMVCVDVYA